MIRRVLIIVVLVVVAIAAFGQTDSPEFNNLVSKVREAGDKYFEEYDKKDFKQSIVALQEVLKVAKDLELSVPAAELEKYKNDIRSINSSTYQTLACAYSLSGKKKEAIAAFTKAVDLGYNRYMVARWSGDFENVLNEKKFIAQLDRIKDYNLLSTLQKGSRYEMENSAAYPKFSYQSADNYYLKVVRETFKLDSVAGNGDELSKIINILKFAHNAIKHDGNNNSICESDAIDIYNYSKATGKGVNCRMMAIALNEMYLSMGIPSRYVTCRPKSKDDYECHVINSVYSKLLHKWIWIDPTFNAYWKDENGNLLGIAEVRQRMIEQKPLVLNDDANWNNQSKQTRRSYMDLYMVKNLYWFDCVTSYRFNPESIYREDMTQHVQLWPIEDENYSVKDVSKKDWSKKITHDAGYFWMAPKE